MRSKYDCKVTHRHSVPSGEAAISILPYIEGLSQGFYSQNKGKSDVNETKDNSFLRAQLYGLGYPRQLYRAFICENVVPVGRVKVNPA